MSQVFTKATVFMPHNRDDYPFLRLRAMRFNTSISPSSYQRDLVKDQSRQWQMSHGQVLAVSPSSFENIWLSGRRQRFAMNQNMLTFTSKVQRRPLSVDTLAISAPARLDVSHFADIVDPLTRSKASHCDEFVGKVGVSDGCWDAALYCGSHLEEFN